MATKKNIKKKHTLLDNPDKLKNLVKEVQDLYLKDKTPWVIGYSGGKDSSATLQLIYQALKGIPKEKLVKDVWVVSSDTMVEIPSVVERVDDTLGKLDKAAKEDGLPIKVQVVEPEIDKTFFVNIIGRGYPAPTRNFRWCTERMKIQPVSKMIEEQVESYGKTIVILGSRKAESMSRAQSLANHTIKGTILKKHSTLINAFVYTPIEDWTTDDVWLFLMQFPSPWGDDNNSLVTLYRKAGGDECPLVIDTTTPSCGNSRFGCWTCTVVEQDKSIHGFIDSGETWLEPMAEFRDMLKAYREEREKRRVPLKGRKGGYGPFTAATRMELLEELLKVEKQVKERYKRKLIQSEELFAIQKIWDSSEYGKGFTKTVAEIYKKVYNVELKGNWSDIEVSTQDCEEELTLAEICKETGVNSDLIKRLMFIENDLTKMRRRRGVYERIDEEIKRDIEQISA